MRARKREELADRIRLVAATISDEDYLSFDRIAEADNLDRIADELYPRGARAAARESANG